MFDTASNEICIWIRPKLSDEYAPTMPSCASYFSTFKRKNVLLTKPFHLNFLQKAFSKHLFEESDWFERPNKQLGPVISKVKCRNDNSRNHGIIIYFYTAISSRLLRATKSSQTIWHFRASKSGFRGTSFGIRRAPKIMIRPHPPFVEQVYEAEGLHCSFCWCRWD